MPVQLATIDQALDRLKAIMRRASTEITHPGHLPARAPSNRSIISTSSASAVGMKIISCAHALKCQVDLEEIRGAAGRAKIQAT
jgi:hypothetical protein